jgi:hypothetical protein
VTGCLELAIDHFEHCIEFLQHCIVPKPQNPVPLALEDLRPGSIALCGCGMLTTVKLDNQAPFYAAEVDKKGRDRMLTTELRCPQLATAQSTPQRTLGVGLIPTEASGGLDIAWHSPSP